MSLLSIFKSGPPKAVTLSPSGEVFTVGKNETILESALQRGLAYPHDCTVGTCGSCRSKLLSGEVKAITPFSYTLSKEELDAGYILACQAIPKTDVAIAIDLANAAPDVAHNISARITNIEPLTHDIVKVTWTLGKPIDYVAGQYMHIRWPGGPGQRSYSFCSAPQAGGNSTASAFVRRVPGGAFSELLFAGDPQSVEYSIDAPLGQFWLRDGTDPIILIGGGSGLSPLMSVLEDAAAKGVTRDAILLFGGRGTRDLYCTDDIAAIAARWQGSFDYWPVLSDEASDIHRTGFVTVHIADALVALNGRPQAYLCGPPGMIDAAIAALLEAGVDIGDIYYDKFTDASHGG